MIEEARRRKLSRGGTRDFEITSFLRGVMIVAGGIGIILTSKSTSRLTTGVVVMAVGLVCLAWETFVPVGRRRKKKRGPSRGA